MPSCVEHEKSFITSENPVLKLWTLRFRCRISASEKMLKSNISICVYNTYFAHPYVFVRHFYQFMYFSNGKISSQNMSPYLHVYGGTHFISRPR